MNPWAFLPGDRLSREAEEAQPMVWRANLALRSVGEVGEYLIALQRMIDCGERWGLVMAAEAAEVCTIAEIYEMGPRAAVRGKPLRNVYRGEDREVVQHLLKTLFLQYRHEPPERRPSLPRALAPLASTSVPLLMGPALSVTEIRYENPVRVTVSAGGYGGLGVVHALRMLQQSSSKQRKKRAEAEILEAQARQDSAIAKVMEYAAEEIVKGRSHVAVSDLVQVFTQPDLQAFDYLRQFPGTVEAAPAFSQRGQ